MQIKEKLNKKNEINGESPYKTRFWELIQKDEMKKKEELKMKIENRVQMPVRMKQYDNLIKNLHPVKKSRNKAEELKKLVSEITHPVRRSRDVRKEYSIERVRQNIPEYFPRTKTQKEFSEERLNSIQINQSKKIDYLAEMRENRERDYLSTTPPTFKLRVKFDDDKLNSVEKIENAEKIIKEVEEKVKDQEKLVKLNRDNVYLQENFGNMIIETIRAKLKILNHIN